MFMYNISIADSVVISLALRSEICNYVKVAKLVLETGGDITPFVEEITVLIHAYNSVNIEPFVSSDPFLRRYFFNI